MVIGSSSFLEKEGCTGNCKWARVPSYLLLADPEKERADQFLNEGTRNQFVVDHAAINFLMKQ